MFVLDQGQEIAPHMLAPELGCARAEVTLEPPDEVVYVLRVLSGVPRRLTSSVSFLWSCSFIGIPLVGRVRLARVPQGPCAAAETPKRLRGARIPQ
jgi:hypothetical protein